MNEEHWNHLVVAIKGDDIESMVEACERLHREAEVEDIPKLVELLKDKDFVVREAAAWPLARLGATHTFEQLFLAYQRGFNEGHDNDGFTTALIELAELHAEDSRKSLADLQTRPNPVLQRYSSWLLTFIGPSWPATARP